MTLHDRYPITSAATRLIRRPAVRALITLVWLLVALGGLLSLKTFLGELKVCRYQALWPNAASGQTFLDRSIRHCGHSVMC